MHKSGHSVRAFRAMLLNFPDLDVCVVVEKFDESIDKIIMNIAWETGFEYDIVISTVTFSKHDFEHGAVSSSQFVKSVILSGVAA